MFCLSFSFNGFFFYFRSGFSFYFFKFVNRPYIESHFSFSSSELFFCKFDGLISHLVVELFTDL